MWNRNFDKLSEFINENSTRWNIPQHLACTICKKLIINSKITPCNCKYCAICIKKYLENGIKCCCGKTLLCGSIKLNLNKDIKDDVNTNIEITNLNIMCPNSPCEYRGKMMDVCDHSKTCQYRHCDQKVVNWGCEIAQGFASFYEEMALNNSTEIKSLKSSIEDLKRSRKNEYEILVKENKSLSEQMKKLMELAAGFETEINELKSSKRKQNIEIDRLNKSNSEFRKNLLKVTNDLKDLEIKGSNVLLPLIDPVKQNIEKMDKEFKEVIKSNKSVDGDIVKCKKCVAECSMSVNCLARTCARMEQQIEEIFFNIGVLIYKAENLDQSSINENLRMYTWSVGNFSSYRDVRKANRCKKLTSNEFHASDRSYKIHFDMYPCGYNGNDGWLSIFAVVTRASVLSYDISVSISIGGRRHHTAKMQRISEDNDIDHCVGVQRFVELEKVFEGSLLQDDTLTIEFLVKKK